MKPLSIVFAGTPQFALPCLEALIASRHQVIHVYTQPDRPAGRGRQLTPSPVKQCALLHHLPIAQPLHFKDEETIAKLEALQPDVMIVIAYGIILPKAILEIPRYGCINVHASLLPRWRGASPIQQTLLHGDDMTGITIMQMDVGMDTGPILLQAPYTLQGTETAETLQTLLAPLAIEPLLETLSKLDTLKPIEQPSEGVTYAPKIKKEEAKIDWEASAQTIYNQIRAYYPWPIAHTYAGRLIMRIHEAAIGNASTMGPPGELLAMGKDGIEVATGEGSLLIKQFQFPGGKVLSAKDWMNAQTKALALGTTFL